MPNLPRNDSRTDAPDAAGRKRRVQRVASAALYTVLVALYTACTFILAAVWAIVIAIALAGVSLAGAPADVLRPS